MGTLTRDRLRVLAVDDSEFLLRSLTTLINQTLEAEIDLTVIQDSRSALRWIEDRHPDIVLTDLEMPEVDGLEIVRHTKRQNVWSQVIVYSSTTSVSKIEQALRLGASDFVSKHSATEDLLGSLQSACDRHLRWQRTLKDHF